MSVRPSASHGLFSTVSRVPRLAVVALGRQGQLHGSVLAHAPAIEATRPCCSQLAHRRTSSTEIKVDRAFLVKSSASAEPHSVIRCNVDVEHSLGPAGHDRGFRRL
jgi:hypothetical protein